MVSNTFKPETYNEPLILLLLFKLANPETFNDDTNVVQFKCEKPLTFNDVIMKHYYVLIIHLNLKNHLH